MTPYRKIQIIKQLLLSKYLLDINIVVSKNYRYSTVSLNYCFRKILTGSSEWQELNRKKRWDEFVNSRIDPCNRKGFKYFYDEKGLKDKLGLLEWNKD